MTFPWKLFLDDCRDAPKDWVLARSVEEAKALIAERGMPDAISFDHDMPYDVPKEPPQGKLIQVVSGFYRENVRLHPTGLDFVGWLWDQVEDGTHVFPEGFTYYVHSANHRGAQMIACIMEKLTGQPPKGWQDWWRKA